MRDIFKNLSVKSKYPLNRGPLNRGFLTLEKPRKIKDLTLLPLRFRYLLNKGATKLGFHCNNNKNDIDNNNNNDNNNNDNNNNNNKQIRRIDIPRLPLNDIFR